MNGERLKTAGGQVVTFGQIYSVQMFVSLKNWLQNVIGDNLAAGQIQNSQGLAIICQNLQ